jgi:thiamine transport system permease protein
LISRRLWWVSGGLVAALILSATLGPLAALLSQPETNTLLLWQDSYLTHVALFSLKQAAASSLLSLLLAIPLARALFHRQFFGKTLLLHLFGLSQVLPVIIALFGLVAVHGAQGWLTQLMKTFGIALPDYLFGLSGILLAHVFFNMPLATRWLVQALEQIPENHWRQAAQLNMPEWSRFRWLEWPAMRRLLPGLASLIFMLCFTSFTIVMALGGGPQATTLEVAIYQALRFDFDLASAGQLACWQLLLGTLVVFSYGWLKPTSASLASIHPLKISYQRTALLPDLLVMLVGLGLFLPPLFAIFWYGLQALFSLTGKQSLLLHTTLQSLQIAFSAGTLALCLSVGLLISVRHLSIRCQAPRWGQLLAGTGSLILLIPTSVLSTGLFILLQEKIDLFSHGFWLVMLLNALAALPYTLRALQEPMTEILVRYDRLADSLGLRGLSRLRWLEWPRLCRHAGRALALGMIFSLGDLAAIAMFGGDDLQTLPWLLYQQLGHYQMDAAAATALILLLLCITLLWLVEWLASRNQHREPPSLLES